MAEMHAPQDHAAVFGLLPESLGIPAHSSQRVFKPPTCFASSGAPTTSGSVVKG
eukprot:m.969435 g.969435  ORF g.969435 m.969435 type:complete len:54 (+) comp23920_c0_seq3:1777-1938(+)